MQEEPPPARILALAHKAKGNPVAWKEYDDRIVIVFEDGRKLVFEKDIEIAEAKQTPAPKSVQKKKEK